MRLFVGIALASETSAELLRLCGRMRKSDDGLRWSRPEGWHITLQFLGNSDADQFACLGAHLAKLRHGPVPVRMGKVNVFERAGAFVVDVVAGPELVSLQQQVSAATQRCGFVPEDRPYHPHITLARAKGEGRRSLKTLHAKISESSPVFSPFIATEFLLYESHLEPGGSKYEVRERFGLRTSATE